jgi:hypothetical protein
MAGDYGHPGACRDDVKVLFADAENFARLLHHLALLGRVALTAIEGLDMGQHVEGDLVRIHGRRLRRGVMEEGV